MISGGGHGKDSKGLGPRGRSAHAPPHLHPHRWTRARRPASPVRRRLLSCYWPRAVSHSGTIFGPRGKRKRKQRKELLFSVEPCPGRDSRACWAREGRRHHSGIQRSCASREPAGGLRFGGAGEGVQMDPPAFHTHRALANCSHAHTHAHTHRRSILGPTHSHSALVTIAIPTTARSSWLPGATSLPKRLTALTSHPRDR